MTHLEQLYSDLLNAEEQLARSNTKLAKLCISQCCTTVRVMMNEVGRARGNKARDELRRGKSVPSSADIAPWPEK